MIAPPPYNKDGYAIRNIRVDGRKTTKGAHRIAWEDAHGPIEDSSHVLHHCDNPPCFNVAHLYLGSPTDNMRDQIARGRHGNLRKTHCPKHGTDLSDPDVTYVDPSGSRKCKICRREIDRARRQRQRER